MKSPCIAVIILFFLLCNDTLFSQPVSQWSWEKGDTTLNGQAVFGTKGMATDSTAPGSREGAVTWVTDNYLWLFGGVRNDQNNSEVFLNDFWKFHLQTKQWTWVGGDSATGSPGQYGTVGIPSTANAPRSRAYATTWYDNAGNLFLFGGETDDVATAYEDYMNDVWKFNTFTNEWTWMSGDSLPSRNYYYGIKGSASTINHPPAKSQAYVFNYGTGKLVMYGGVGYRGFMNDLWEYNNGLWTWIHGDSTAANQFGSYGTRTVASPNNKPGGRSEGTSWIDDWGNLWLFGGHGFAQISQGFLNDLWKYDVTSNQWTWMNGSNQPNEVSNYGTKRIASSSNVPGAREGGAGWSPAFSEYLWLFGGYGNDATNMGFLNDVWVYDVNNNQWIWIQGDSIRDQTGLYGTQGIGDFLNKPGGKSSVASWADQGGNMWLFGGRNGYTGTSFSNDLWLLSPYVPLPVHLISFAGVLNGDKVQLTWTTENEQNFSHYEVERSFDGRSWSKVKIVKLKGERGRNEYSADDDIPQLTTHGSRLFYRLKMINKDGSFSYSKAILITNHSKLLTLNIYPNPATTQFNIQFDKKRVGSAEIEVTDLDGRVVLRKVVQVSGVPIAISTANIPAGHYTIKVTCNGENAVQKLIVANK